MPAMTRYCYFCLMDVFFTPLLTEQDAQPTLALAKNCQCWDLDDVHLPLSPVTDPKEGQRKVRDSKKESETSEPEKN